MYLALAVILMVLAVFSVVAAHRPRPASDQLRGFVYVGAVALLGLAGAVIVVGIVADRAARAEGLAIFGFFTYAIYLAAAVLIVRVTRPR